MKAWKVMAKRLLQYLWVFSFLVLIAPGCVSGWPFRHLPKTTPPSAPTPALQRAPVIALTVEDNRHFEKMRNGFHRKLPHENMYFETERTDTNLTARCVSENHLLAEGESVATLVRSAIVKAFHTRGYRVVGTDHPQASHAKHVNVSVTKFWIWDRVGVQMKKRHVEVLATFGGDIPGLSNATKSFLPGTASNTRRPSSILARGSSRPCMKRMGQRTDEA